MIYFIFISLSISVLWSESKVSGQGYGDFWAKISQNKLGVSHQSVTSYKWTWLSRLPQLGELICGLCSLIHVYFSLFLQIRSQGFSWCDVPSVCLEGVPPVAELSLLGTPLPLSIDPWSLLPPWLEVGTWFWYWRRTVSMCDSVLLWYLFTNRGLLPLCCGIS